MVAGAFPSAAPKLTVPTPSGLLLFANETVPALMMKFVVVKAARVLSTPVPF